MKKIFLILICIVGSWFFAGQIHAASFLIEVDQVKINSAQPLTVRVYLNTEDASVDVFYGSLDFLEELLSLRDVSDGNSIVSLWAQKPGPDRNTFSGMIPGGYSGNKGLLFSATLMPKKNGSGELQIKDNQFLRAGEEVKINSAGVLEFLISDKVVAATKDAVVDIQPPENFNPEVLVENKKTFILFNAQDKGSGISHYEIKEGKADFIRAQSPYQLKKRGNADVYITAVDNQGNERLEHVILQFPPWYKEIKNWLFIVFAICCSYIIGLIVRRRYNLKNKI